MKTVSIVCPPVTFIFELSLLRIYIYRSRPVFSGQKYVKAYHFNNPRFYVFPYVFTVPSNTYTVDTISRKQRSLLKLTSLMTTWTSQYKFQQKENAGKILAAWNDRRRSLVLSSCSKGEPLICIVRNLLIAENMNLTTSVWQVALFHVIQVL